MSLKTLKWAAILCFIVGMAVLLGGGIAMKKDLPPYPGKVVDAGGKVLFEKSDIIAGQDVYQRFGLMDHGAVWGHGSQRGPEFSAATLNIIAETIGGYMATADYGKSYAQLDDLQQDIVDVKIKAEIKPNRYDAASDTLKLTDASTGEQPLRKVKSAMVFFPIRSLKSNSDCRLHAFFSGQHGWPQPFVREKITLTPTTGRRTHGWVTSRVPTPFFIPSPVFWPCWLFWRCLSTGSIATAYGMGKPKGRPWLKN
jgi:hypothetical protein